MRTAPAAISNFLPTANTCWRADLVTLSDRSGTAVFRWANSDVNIAIGGNTYTAGPILGRTLRQSCNLEIDTLELSIAGNFVVGNTTLAMLAMQGALDDYRVKVDHIIGAFPGDVSLGVVPSWFEGGVAAVEPTPLGVKLTVKSDLETLAATSLPKFTYQPQCGNVVYDSNCGVSKAAFTLSGTVAAGVTATVIPSSVTSKPDGYFNLGVVTFTSGINAGISRPVRSSTQTGGVLTLAVAFPNAPAVGDAFTVYPGCARTWAACLNVFANTAKYRGYRHIPTNVGGQ